VDKIAGGPQSRFGMCVMGGKGVVVTTSAVPYCVVQRHLSPGNLDSCCRAVAQLARARDVRESAGDRHNYDYPFHFLYTSYLFIQLPVPGTSM
jgi:hypothetical protein